MTTSPPVWKRFLAGTVSGAALVVVGHPLDTLRVALQVDVSGTARLVGLPHPSRASASHIEYVVPHKTVFTRPVRSSGGRNPR